MLYIPVNLYNFNSIFASEAISPGCYYSKRKYGSKRFFYNSANPQQGLLFIYNFLPEADTKLYDEDSFVFYIGINENYFQERFLINKNEEQFVFAYNDTIYLNFCSPVFIFRNAEERDIALAKSLSSLETKTIEKYYNNFVTFSELGAVAQQNKVLIQIADTNQPSDEIILRDEIINSYKGLIYVNVISKISSKSDEELIIGNAIHNFHKAWQSYLSALQNQSIERKVKNGKRDNQIESALKIINHVAGELKTIVSKYYFIDHLEKIKNFLSSKEVSNDDTNVMLRMTAKFPELADFLYNLSEKDNSSIQFEIEEIKREIGKIAFYQPSYRKKIIDKIDEKIRRCSNRISQIEIRKEQNSNEHLNIGIQEYSLKDNQIKFVSVKKEISDKEVLLHERILNTLFIKNKYYYGEISGENINELIIAIGNVVTELFGEESAERHSLIIFYNFINGKQSNFDIKSIKSIIIINFVSFLLKYKSIEDLISYCEKFYIPSYYFSINYWGLFNGFASISKIYTKPLWEKENSEAVFMIDLTLQKELEHLLPQLKNITLTKYIGKEKSGNPTENEIQNESVSLKSVADISYLLLPVNKRSDLKQFEAWIERCIETCMLSLIMEYDNMPYKEALKKDFASELYGKNRPKGFTVRHVELVTELLDYELFEKLKLLKQGVIKA